MSDYKRLTKRDGDSVMYARPIESDYIVQIDEEMRERDCEIMHRLCDLEDKLGSGELGDIRALQAEKLVLC